MRTFLRRLGCLTLILILLVLVGGYALIHYPSRYTVDPEKVDEYVYLGQGWGDTRESPLRQLYYYTPQGTSVKGLRYRWFVNLELPSGKRRFADPDHMRAFGFIVDPEPTAANPDRLPVGFTKHFNRDLNEDVLDLNCAACHTAEIQARVGAKRYAIRIDGGPASHAFTSMRLGSFGPVLLGSLASTWLNPWKFDRFARKVLGPEAYPAEKVRLKRDMREVLDALVKQAWTDRSRHLYPTEEGFGRTDALGRISNTVFGDELDPANYRVGNAPVSYPYLWNIWKFDWVQYNASVNQPMARNMGESLGVGATVHMTDAYGRPLAPGERFRAATLVENLVTIEHTLQQLLPPRWPESLLGTIDRAKAERGRQLFLQHCFPCHGVREADAATKAVESPLRGAYDPLWILRTLPVTVIGTDPTAALNFVKNRLDFRKTGLTARELADAVRPDMEEALARRLKRLGTVPPRQLEEAKQRGQAAIENALAGIDPARVSLGEGLNYVGQLTRQKYYRERGYTAAQTACMDGFGTLDTPMVIAAYKARPLQGTWATAPFLHNGSVPNLYELLSPVRERSKRFYLGRREYDPVKVGFVTEPLKGARESFWFDTSQTGNANTGHEFRAGYAGWAPGSPPQFGVIGPELPPVDRWALVEYLKIHEDPPTPAGRVPPQCF